MKKKSKTALGVVLLAVLVTAALAGTFRRYRIATNSCAPALMTGDLVVVNACAYDLTVPFTWKKLARLSHPGPGDIVACRLPENEPGSVYLKRVVGIPGDVVELRQGRLVVNGRETRQRDRDRSEGMTGDFGPVQVEEGRYFLLGDNREKSRDSRHFGTVPREDILGKVVLGPRR